MDGFYVPLVVDDLSSKRVLTTELVSGKSNTFISFLFFFFFVRVVWCGVGVGGGEDQKLRISFRI